MDGREELLVLRLLLLLLLLLVFCRMPLYAVLNVVTRDHLGQILDRVLEKMAVNVSTNGIRP